MVEIICIKSAASLSLLGYGDDDDVDDADVDVDDHYYVNHYERWMTGLRMVSRQLVYGHFVYDTSSTDISSTDISSTMTFLAEIEAGVMKRILYQQKLD